MSCTQNCPSAGFKIGHFLTTAYHRHTRRIHYLNEVSAFFTNIVFRIRHCNILLVLCFCFVSLLYHIFRCFSVTLSHRENFSFVFCTYYSTDWLGCQALFFRLGADFSAPFGESADTLEVRPTLFGGLNQQTALDHLIHQRGHFLIGQTSNSGNLLDDLGHGVQTIDFHTLEDCGLESLICNLGCGGFLLTGILLGQEFDFVIDEINLCLGQTGHLQQTIEHLTLSGLANRISSSHSIHSLSRY